MKSKIYPLVLLFTAFFLINCSTRIVQNSNSDIDIVYFNILELNRKKIDDSGFLKCKMELDCYDFEDDVFFEMSILSKNGAAHVDIYRSNNNQRLLSFSYSEAKEIRKEKVAINDYEKGLRIKQRKYLVPIYNNDMRFYTSDSIQVEKAFRKCLFNLPRD